MGKIFDGIDDTLAAWIAKQPMWFVATAPLAADGRVNVSPRGHDSSPCSARTTSRWVDYTGSGVETIAHLRENGRICVMFCSLRQPPAHRAAARRGHVTCPVTRRTTRWSRATRTTPSTRAVVVVDVDRVSDSCGYGVPVMDLVGERDLLRLGRERRGPDGLAEYRAKHNAASIDGLAGL